MPEKEKEPEPIVVVDRRRFTTEGERRAGVEAAPPAPDTPPEAPATVVAPPSAPESETERQARQAYDRQGGSRQPKLDFETLIRSLASSAMLQLGLVEDPVHGRIPPDFEAARDTIDMLAALEEKTRGNLAPREQQLLSQVLYELRVSYVALTSGPAPGGKPGAPRRGS